MAAKRPFKYIPSLTCENEANVIFVRGGIFNGDNPLKRVLPFNMFRLSLFFLVSQTLQRLLKPLNQSKFICNLLTGLILGTHTLGVFKGYEEAKNLPKQKYFLNMVSLFALTYHVFIISVKIEGSRLMKLGKKPLLLGLLTPLCAFIVIQTFSTILHPITFKIAADNYTMSFHLACNSIMNVYAMLEEFDLLTSEVGQVAVSSTLVTEMLVVANRIFSTLHISVTNGFIKSMAPMSMVLVVMVCVLRPALKWIVRRTPDGHPTSEIYVLGVFVTAGVLCLLWDILVGLPIVGIQIFGLMVPNGPPLGSAVVKMCETFIDNFLLPFLFLSVGDMVNFKVFAEWKPYLVYELILIAGYLTRTLATVVIAMIYNMRYRQAMTLGLVMDAAGVMESGFAWILWVRQRADITFSTQFVLSSLLKGLVVAPLSLYFYRRISKNDDSIRGFELSIQSASMASKFRVLACIDDENDIPGIITLLEASNPTDSSPVNAYLIHFNELVGQVMPTLTPHKQHKRICKHNGCIHIMNALKGYCDDSRGRVALQFFTMIAQFRNINEGLCRLAQDHMIPLIIVPYVYKSPRNYNQQSASSDLNRKIQAQAPCTVGIFVDRGTTIKNRNQLYFSYKVVVIFFGGEDDREVLAYAARMSGHPGVIIMMLRIVVRAYQGKKGDINLDETLVDAFKTKIADNACAVFREVEVEDWLEAVQEIRSVDNEYDLVIVGRRHGENLHDQQISVLSESPELGFIGETIASVGFNGRVFSILVMQHCMGVDRDVLGNLMQLEED